MNTMKRIESKKAAEHFTENQLQILCSIALIDQALANEILTAAYKMKKSQIPLCFEHIQTVYPVKDNKELFTWLIRACLRNVYISNDSLHAIMNLSCAMPEFKILANLISAGVSEEKAQFFAKEHMEIKNGPFGLADVSKSLYDIFLKQFFANPQSDEEQKKDKLEKSKLTASVVADKLFDSTFVKSMRRQGLHMKEPDWYFSSSKSYLLNRLDKPCKKTKISMSYDKISIVTNEQIDTITIETEVAEIDMSTGYEELTDKVKKAGKEYQADSEFYSRLDDNTMNLLRNLTPITLNDYRCYVAEVSHPSHTPASMTFICSQGTCVSYIPENNDLNGISMSPDYEGRHDHYRVFAYKRGELFYTCYTGNGDFTKREVPVRPLMLADAVRIARACPMSVTYMDTLLSYESKTNPFMKDVLKLYDRYVKNGQDSHVVFPLNISEAFKCHNWNEYFTSHYKIAKDLHLNFNKIDPRISYIAISVAPYIVKEDIQRLVSWLKHCNVDIDRCVERMHFCRSRKNRAKEALNAVYPKALKMKDIVATDPFDDGYDDAYDNVGSYSILYDWISMSLQLNIPVSLKKSSIRKIKEEHDRLNDLITQKQILSIKGDKKIVPKHSIFNGLEKKLPNGFERITTHKRLMAEGLIQHHCVASYEQNIEMDMCAIFSVISPQTGNRHTIEILKEDKKTFYVNQIQKKYNSGCDEDIVNALTEALGAKAMRRFIQYDPMNDLEAEGAEHDIWADPWGDAAPAVQQRNNYVPGDDECYYRLRDYYVSGDDECYYRLRDYSTLPF